MNKRFISAFLVALVMCGGAVTLVGCGNKSDEAAVSANTPPAPTPAPNVPDKRDNMMPGGGPAGATKK